MRVSGFLHSQPSSSKDANSRILVFIQAHIRGQEIGGVTVNPIDQIPVLLEFLFYLGELDVK